jgi:DNA-binding MarR family transcriptional regulator
MTEKGSGKEPRRDIVDRHIEDWKREFPSMDVATEGLVERIAKLARYFERSLGETATAFGLSMQDWDLLSALRRVGPPYRLSPTQLAGDLMLSSGAMTARLDRLEKAGLIRRRPDPDDRRAIRVQLTEKGSKTWGDAVDVQAERERRIAAALSEREKEILNGLLRRLMLTFEETAGPPPRRAELAEAYTPQRPRRPRLSRRGTGRARPGRPAGPRVSGSS